MLRAQRSPARARSTARLWAWTPRTRTSIPRGLRTRRSPAPTLPAMAVPVATMPMPGSEKTRVDRQAELPLRRTRRTLGIGRGGTLGEMRGERGNAVPSAARHGEDRRVGITRCRQQVAQLGRDRFAARGVDAVDLGDDCGHVADADQLENVEMFERLRPRPVIGGDDQQHAVDRQHAGQHVGKEALVARHIDESRARCRRAGWCRRSRDRSSGRAAFLREAGRHRRRSAPAPVPSC